MKTIDERMRALEGNLICPGTTITRVFKPSDPGGKVVKGKWQPPEHGLQWCVAIGVMEMPKKFFYGDTIDEAVKEAEKWKRTDRRKR